jgi:hypothetical protein
MSHTRQKKRRERKKETRRQGLVTVSISFLILPSCRSYKYADIVIIQRVEVIDANTPDKLTQGHLLSLICSNHLRFYC